MLSVASNTKRILYVVNDAGFFISHRLPIAVAAKEQGFDVYVAAPKSKDLECLVSQGFSVHNIGLNRSGSNPLVELFALFSIFSCIWSVRPSVVHLITIKPVIYGGIVARLLRVPKVVAAVSGLGTLFITKGLLSQLKRRLVAFVYRLALNSERVVVIFQNPSDSSILKGLAKLNRPADVLIKGSGVDLNAYPYLPEPEGRVKVVMASRLLKDKGVYEYLAAAKRLLEKGINADFFLAGEPDFGNLSSLTEVEYQDAKESPSVECLGRVDDIASLFGGCHIVVLPSYREGLPKVLIEAAACGRAVVTTDVPGCRDAIIPNETGLLVAVKDSLSLADNIEQLILSARVRLILGREGRAFAEREFSITKVVELHIALY